MKAIKDNMLDDQIHNFLNRKFQEFPELITEQNQSRHSHIFNKLHDYMSVRKHISKPSVT